MLPAHEIMNITEPGELFPENAAQIKEEYSRLAKIWHPDNNGNSAVSNEVMAKINSLYKKGLEMIRSGKWKMAGLIRLHGRDGRVHEIKYHKELPFELGTAYICDRVAVYVISEEFRDFYQNAVRRIKGFTYADDKMKAEMSKYLPVIAAEFETADGSLGLVLEKDPDMLLLEDVLAYYGGCLPDRHVAWILGTLYNLECYLEYSGICHNDISPGNCFISPKKHTSALLGGWWYSIPLGSRMMGVTERIYSILPPQVRNNRVSSILTDMESIRLLGRELLGDRAGTYLEASGVPAPLTGWLRGAASGSAFEEYSRWFEVLKESYGARRFVEMDLGAAELYSKP